MTRALDPVFVMGEVEHLRRAHPELWEGNDEQLKLDTLEGQTTLNDFLTRVVHHILLTDALLRGSEALIADMKLRRDNFERRKEALRALALKVMDHAGIRKSIELPTATLSIHAGSRKVIITDEASLPGDCFRIRAEPNKTEIKQRIEAGDIVPGASLSNAEPVLHLRVK